MKITVSYKCLDYHSLKHKTVKVKYECPNFAVIKDHFINDYLPKEFQRDITIKDQVDDYVLNLDKSKLLIEHDLHCIVDWSISIDNIKQNKNPKLSKKEQVFIIAKELIKNETMLNDFAAIYGNIFNSIKKHSAIEQFEIVIATYNTALKSVSNTYKSIVDYNQKLNSLDKSLFRNPKHPYLMLDKDEIKTKLLEINTNNSNIIG